MTEVAFIALFCVLMKAVIIARVSTEEQKVAGNSLPAQEARLKRYCQDKGLKVTKKFSFDESAYKNNREMFDEVMEYIKHAKEPLALCLDKVDRLSRSIFDKRVSWLYDQALLDKLELHFASENQVINSRISAAEKFNFSISLGLSKYYSDAISDNIKRANERIRSEGIVCAVPTGYIRRNRVVTVDKERAEGIREAFEMFSTGKFKQVEISGFLNTKGVTTRTGKPYTLQKVQIMLRNSFYCGIADSKYGKYKHIYPALITKETFDRCQQLLAKKEGIQHKGSFGKHEFIFRGILKCEGCGYRINPDGPKKGKYIYHRCIHQKCPYHQQVIREEVLVEQVEKLFGEVAKNINLKKVEVSAQRYLEHLAGTVEFEIQKAKEKLESVEKMRNVLLDKYLSGSIREIVYKEKDTELDNTIGELQKVVQSSTVEAVQRVNTVVATIKALKKLPVLWKSSNCSQKNMILKLTVSNSTQSGTFARFFLDNTLDSIGNFCKNLVWCNRLDSNQ